MLHGGETHLKECDVWEYGTSVGEAVKRLRRKRGINRDKQKREE